MNHNTPSRNKITAVLLSLLMVVSVSAVYATAVVATGPDGPAPNSTPSGDTTAENQTASNESPLETADAKLAEQSGDASLVRDQLALVQDLNEIDEKPTSERDQALDMAETVLSQRKEWAAREDKPLPKSMVPLFEAQQTKIDGARTLLRTNEQSKQEGLARAVTLAKQGTKMQAAQVDDDITMSSGSGLASVNTPDHESPSAAVTELLDRYDVTPTAQDAAAMRELDDAPEPTRSALTDYLDAYLAFQSETAAGNYSGTLSARNQLLEETNELQDALEDQPPGITRPQNHGGLIPYNQIGTVGPICPVW